MNKSSMTLDELLEILSDLSCEYKVHEVEGENARWIECEILNEIVHV